MANPFPKVLVLSLSLMLCGAQASATEFRSGEEQTHLIELFSSEGCSSCPPADAWLATLRSKPELWKLIVPIEFHVDYWNRLGWTDKLSKSIFTERQQIYAREWTNGNVYTPGFVLDGSEWRPASDPVPWQSLKRRSVGKLIAKRTGKTSFQISFEPTGSSTPSGAVQVHAALLGNGLESKVSSGENAGTVLRHEFAVLSIAQVKMTSEKTDHYKTPHYAATIDLTPPASRNGAKSYSVAFWVTRGESQKPLQAVGGDLSL